MEEIRRELRKDPTPSESLLWARLRGSQLSGYKFRRQHSIGVYILDFYCPAKRVCVEVDGRVHKNEAAIAHDQERDATLAQLLIKTLRFSNDDVALRIEAVLEQISNHLKA
jgi:very-short-patch-repair endonuclease